MRQQTRRDQVQLQQADGHLASMGASIQQHAQVGWQQHQLHTALPAAGLRKYVDAGWELDAWLQPQARRSRLTSAQPPHQQILG